MEPVKCVNCGFLAVRTRETRQLVEAEAGMRQKWHVPMTSTRLECYERVPLCFARAADFTLEAGQNAPTDHIATAIQRDRPCTAFTPWCHGFTPKEHQEMLNAKQLQDFQAEQREKDRQFQLQSREADAKREDSRNAASAQRADARDKRVEEFQEAQNSKSRSRQFLNVLIGGFLTLVGGAVANYFMPKPQPQIIVMPAQEQPSPDAADK